MNIKINDVHFTADQKLVEFVTKKVSKLDNFYEGIISAEIIMKVVKPESAKNKEVELKLSIPSTRDYLFAKKQADTFEEATDITVEAVKKQLKKIKEKQRD